MKRPDLLILVAVWEFVTALGTLIGVAAISVFAFPGVAWVGGPPLAGHFFGLSLAVLVLLCYAGLAVSGGIGLLLGKEWGRIVSIVHAALTLLWIPIGTVIGVLVLIYLTKYDVVKYFESSDSEH